MRENHQTEAMRRLLAPRTIAVVGVSEKPGSFGQRSWHNLREFAGTRYAVNPRHSKFENQTCYRSLSDLPDVPDCVLICTPASQVEAILKECAAVRAGAAIVYASGYAELGSEEGRQAQERLTEIAQKSGVLLLGPNCMGVIHNALKASLTFAPEVAFSAPADHSIALVSQSGAIGFALLQATEHGTTFSHMITSGNATDVDVADQIAFLAEDATCGGIALVFESVRDPARLIAAGIKAREAGKSIAVFKVARSEAGTEAAISHTGALAGADAAYRAAFQRAGMVLVDDIEHLLETAVFLAKSARLPPVGEGAAVLTASGGLGIIAADKAVEAAVPLPQPGHDVRAILESRIPAFGSARNPCDVTAQVVNDLDSLTACSAALFKDDSYGVLVYPHTGAHAIGTERLRAIEGAAARQSKMACFVWSTAWLEGPGAAEAEAMTNAAVFRSMQSCMRAIAARNWLRRLSFARDDMASTSSGAVDCIVRRHLARAGGDVLTEVEGLDLLACAGIPVVSHQMALSPDMASAVASDIGFPVAMKVVSRDVPHKSESGGVVLHIQSPREARQAFVDIMQRVAHANPEATLDGIVVQPMAKPGVELILGARRDPVFGPLVIVGLGGVFVEILRDAAVGMAPCTKTEAKALLESLKGARIFDGFRGAPAVQLDAVAGVVERFSQLVAALGDDIEELEINPLICREAQVLAVDSLIRRARATVTTEIINKGDSSAIPESLTQGA